MPPDTSFLVNGFKPTVAAADPRDVIAFQQNRQLGAQQLQSGSMDLQQKQTDLNDQQIYSSAMKDAGGDPQKAFMRAAQLGMSGKGLMQYQQNLLKIGETRSITDKNNAEAASAKASAQEKANTQVVGTTSALLNLPPSQRAAAYPAAMQKLAKDMNVDPTTLPQDYASFGGDAALVQFHDQHLTQTEQLAAQKATDEKAAAQQKLLEDKAEADRKAKLAKPTLDKAISEATVAGNTAVTGAPVGGTGPYANMTATAAQEAKDRAAAQAQKAANDKAQRNIEGGKLSIEQKKFDATFGQGLDANGRPLSPEDRKAAAMLDPTAVAQANYQIAGPSTLRTTPLGQAQLAKILAINPSYKGEMFGVRNKIAQDYAASGESGKKMTSTDTALAHLDAVRRAGEALHNTDPRFINAIANEFGVQVGASPKNTYDAIINMVSPEISKAVIGEAGGQSEREEFKKPFSSSASDAQREAAIGGTAGLLGARFHKMGQAYESDMGKPLERKLSPESQAMLDKYTGGGQGAAAPAAVPPSVTRALSSQGPGIHKLSDGSSWMKAKDGTVTKQ